MAKVTSEKKYISFIKGLVTEASALNFPENASLDEDNFDLEPDGSRERRQGVDYEAGYALVPTGISAAVLEGTKKSFHRWDFPGGSSEVVLGVVRAHDSFWFVNLLSASPSTSLMNGGAAVTISGLADSYIETATINTFFVVVSADLDYAYYFKYNPDTDVVTSTAFPIQVRDFWGVSDGLNTTDRPTTLSDLHRYNLINQGWNERVESICAGPTLGYTIGGAYVLPSLAGFLANPTPAYGPPPGALSCTFTTLGVYPSNADIWTLGKVGDATSASYEKYSPNVLIRNSTDNTEAPRGSHIIDAFRRGESRRIITGIVACPSDREGGRLTTVASFGGRVCYSGVASRVLEGDSRSPNSSGFIYFSQIISGEDKLGKCYQEADPTSPNISDIIDTDGGIIHIPEASRILKLVSVKESLIVFAENGVWEIYGDTGGFKASNFQVAKIATTGILNPRTVTVAGNTVVYWARAGIFALVPNPQTGRYALESLSLNTIQSYYINDISELAKRHAIAFYDERENHIRWLYNDTAGYDELVDVNHYNRILNLDLSLQAFYKYSISSLATNSPSVCDFVEIIPQVTVTTNVDVYVGNDAVLSDTDQVITPVFSHAARTELYNFLIFRGTSFTFGSFNNDSYMDWKTADTVGVNYSSYLITGYETFDDIMRNKMVPYIFFYIKRSEDGFTASGTELIANHQSSCLVQAQWNWCNTVNSNKWGTQFQAYRYRRAYVPVNAADTYDTGDFLIVTKNKLRGRGRALSLKIESEQGKKLHLLGWALIINGDGTP